MAMLALCALGVATVYSATFDPTRGASHRYVIQMYAIAIGIVAKEPDLGTAMTLLPVFFAVGYLAGMPMRILGVLCVCGLLAAPVAWKVALKDYQKQRVVTFFDPSLDAKGAGYQQIQARITVG